MPKAHSLNAIRRRIAAVIATATLAACCASCGSDPSHAAADFCAILPDAVGLYVGNPVTQMGYKIGEIQKVTPSATSVQVDFALTESRVLPGDVKAVVRSNSILADRALELVGNYSSGPKLAPGQCVPLSRSTTPKSISEIIGSANTFVNGITPQGSSNIADVVNQLDQALHGNGAGVNQLLTASSRVLDNPDATIGSLGSVVSNLAVLTGQLVELRDPLKQVLNDSVITAPYIRDALIGSNNFIQNISPVVAVVSDLETHAGDEIQLTLDTTADLLRINTPHINGWLSLNGGILKSVPWWINAAVNHLNNHQFFMFFRPPMYRIRTPDGPLICAIMNGNSPGSCANVAGQPYGVDVNLLQYVFMNANR